MVLIIILFKRILMMNCYLLTDTDSLTYEIKSKNVYEEFLSGNIYLTLVIIQKIQSFLIRLTKTLLVKSKMNLVKLL